MFITGTDVVYVLPVTGNIRPEFKARINYGLSYNGTVPTGAIFHKVRNKALKKIRVAHLEPVFLDLQKP